MSICDFYPVLLLIMLFPMADMRKEWLDCLSPVATRAQKGFFAIVVMLHHLSQRIAYSPLMNLFSNMGIVAVSVFFFISGFALMSGYKKSDGNYGMHILRIRIPSVLLPLITVLAIYVSGYYFILHKSFKYISLHLVHDSNTWFMFIILAFYLFFMLFSFIFKRSQKAIFIAMLIASAALFIYRYITAPEEVWWYNTCFSFNLGMLVFLIRPKLKTILAKKRVVLFASTSALFIVLFEFSGTIYQHHLINSLVVQICCISFCAALMIFLTKMKIGNPILNFLGEISFELYLIHGFVILLLGGYQHYAYSDFKFMTIVIFASIAGASLLHLILWHVLAAYRKKVQKVK